MNQNERGSRPSLTEAKQRHANEYITRLMTNDDQAALALDFGQIAVAVRRVKAEEIGSQYHPGQIEVKFLALLGTFVPKQLDKLVNRTATAADFNDIQSAIESVELGETEYPVPIGVLKQMLAKLL